MKFLFTKHTKEKIRLINKYGFSVSQSLVKKALNQPLKTEQKSDGTEIASILLTDSHLLRIVYRMENDIIIIITCYPARRKSYGI